MFFNTFNWPVARAEPRRHKAAAGEERMFLNGGFTASSAERVPSAMKGHCAHHFLATQAVAPQQQAAI
jgi:hypothetical protein